MSFWEKLKNKVAGKKMIGNIWPQFFDDYKTRTGKDYLRYIVTSGDRPDDPPGSPHKIPGNAIDFTLRNYNQYSPMIEYKELMRYMVIHWKYRAGADLTDADGNVHIHIDLGQNHATGMPYFFDENKGKWIREIKTPGDIV